MKQQNDWYTGIEYNHNEPETHIAVDRIRLESRTRSQFHEQVEIYYIFSGKAQMEINGSVYSVSEGSLVCLYSHHFYRFAQVEKPVEALRVQFHIGLFMFMSWERHPQHANAMLVYDTCPVVHLAGKAREQIGRLAAEILEEDREGRFESGNMIAYKTLELHAYHCRYAFEAIGSRAVDNKSIDGRANDNKAIGSRAIDGDAFGSNDIGSNGRIGGDQAWKVIIRVMLAPSKNFTLEEMAADCGCSQSVLNRRIKDACGYTFHQLCQFGKLTNACALLHFPELDVDYISDILGFSSKQAFYRMFTRYCHQTPVEYRSRLWNDAGGDAWTSSAAIRFLQYMHLNFFEDLTITSLCDKFCIKEYTVKEIFKNAFGMSFGELLGQIRVSYACAFLSSTPQSILGIATLCGFDSLSTFQRIFYQWMGQTPGEYRKVSGREK